MSCAFLKRYWALSQIHTQTEPLVAGQLSCDTRLKQFHRSKSARYVSPPWRQGSGNVLWHCFTFYASDLVESRLHCTVWGRRVLLLVAVRWSWPAPEQYVLQHSNQCLRQGLCKTRKKYWGTHGKCPSNFCRMLWYVMISYDMLWYYILLLLLSVAPGKSWVQSGADRRGNGSEPCTCETLSFSQLDVADWMSTFYANRVQHIPSGKLT